MRLTRFGYTREGYRGPFDGEHGQEHVPVMLCSPIQGCVSNLLPAASGQHRLRGGEKPLPTGQDQGVKRVMPLGCGTQ